jgi:Secretion system C-terminal sorting domain
MKRILFLSIALCFSYNSVKAQMFTQDFSSSTTVADYVSATPNLGQFEGLTQSSAAPSTALVTTITNGALRFNRTATASIWAFRNYTYPVKPTFVQLRMDFEASGNVVGTQTPVFSVFVGSGFTTASTGTNSAYASRFGIVAQANPGEFKISSVDNIGGSAPQTNVFSGKQTITFIINNSGVDQTYTAPDATTEAVANGKMDVWIGITKGINDFSLRNTASPLADISGFKIQATSQSGTGIYDFDNIEFRDLLGNLSTNQFDNSLSNIKVYPNPTEGVFEINNLPLSLETINLGLYSVDSKLIGSKTYNVNNGTVKLDISGLAKGVYFVKGDSDSPLFAKVIKK